jgi:hypothetical protein
VNDVEQPVAIRESRRAAYAGGMEIALHYVFVFELFEQTNFSNGGAWNTFIFCFQPDLLEGDDFV